MPIKAPQSSKELLPFALGESGSIFSSAPSKPSGGSESSTHLEQLQILQTKCEEFSALCNQTNRAGTAILMDSLAEVFKALATGSANTEQSVKQCAVQLDSAISTLNRAVKTKPSA